MGKFNPCLACGACCANFRVSFYWGEANDATEGGVPVHLTEKLNDFRRVMLGTNRPEPRCIALKGEIGSEVNCAIYPQRTSTCRDFEASWVNGVPRALRSGSGGLGVVAPAAGQLAGAGEFPQGGLNGGIAEPQNIWTANTQKI